MLLALLFAAAEFGVPLPVTEVTVVADSARTSDSNIDHILDAPPPIPAPAEPPPLSSVIDHETGWVTYSDGTIRCVTAAPCEAETGWDPSQYTYNWETEESANNGGGDGWR